MYTTMLFLQQLVQRQAGARGIQFPRVRNEMQWKIRQQGMNVSIKWKYDLTKNNRYINKNTKEERQFKNVIKSGKIHKSYNPQIKDRRINYLFILLPFLWMRRVGKQMKLAEHDKLKLCPPPIIYPPPLLRSRLDIIQLQFWFLNFAGAGPFYPALAPQHCPLLGVGIKIPI